jgi:hypothetical protein
MRSGGRSFITFHLLNPTSLAAMRAEKASSQFFHQLDHVSWSNDKVTPENGVAFAEEFVRSEYARNGLTISTTCYGAWCGRDDGVRFQDIIVALKE